MLLLWVLFFRANERVSRVYGRVESGPIEPRANNIGPERDGPPPKWLRANQWLRAKHKSGSGPIGSEPIEPGPIDSEPIEPGPS